MEDALAAELEVTRGDARSLCLQVERQAAELIKIGNQRAHLRRRLRDLIGAHEDLQAAHEDLAAAHARLATERDAWRTLVLLRHAGGD